MNDFFEWQDDYDRILEHEGECVDSEWFDEHSTWRSIFFSYPKNNK